MTFPSKCAISGFLDPIPSSKDSHYRGWMELCARNIEAFKFKPEVTVLTGPEDYKRWPEFEVVYFHHGLYYYGEDYALNMFGGMTGEKADDLAERFEAFLRIGEPKACTGSLEYKWPLGLFDALENRLSSKNLSGHRLAKLIAEARGKIIDEHDYFDAPSCTDVWKFLPRHVDNTGIVIGDSHSGASWEPGYTIYRNDRETLYGALNRGIWKKIAGRFTGTDEDLARDSFRKIKVHYGNIDVRHHLCRLPDPKASCRTLVLRLMEQLSDTLRRPEVTLVAPYPIENESRRISKSVFYKDTAFYGSWSARNDVRLWMTDFMREAASSRGWKILEWPESWLTPNGELSFDVMEKPKSIHLSPRFYLTPPFKDEPTSLESFFGQ